MRKLTTTKYETGKSEDTRYVIELEGGPEDGVIGIDVVCLTEAEAKVLHAWLTEKLSSVEGVPF